MRLIMIAAFAAIFLSPSCNQISTDVMNEKDHQKKNNLANETSPYLLQHQFNPVDWHPWSEEAFKKARDENKIVLISIGYSACHWCHVMERESFEDDSVAKVMNEHFVSIKVDREERPDVDQIYMNAVQLMQQRGGWPLNCFTTPDGKPFYGGTYFTKEEWLNVMNGLIETWREEPQKILEYADKLTEGVQTSELIVKNNTDAEFHEGSLSQMVQAWKPNFDPKDGGPNRAPKFPMPNNLEFLLKYGFTNNDQEIKDHVKLTLDKMAMGGIYDQIGGGFARYSTDMKWKVPHFEKMLYDNGQLVSVYSQAFQAFKSPLYKQIVQESIEWVKREMTGPDGEFYSALDADSEGEEGKFYVWNKEELDSLLGEDFDWFQDFYNVNNKGLWEGHYILLTEETPEEFAQRKGLDIKDFSSKLSNIKRSLLEAREQRERPGLDDKTLTSWNAIMIKGLVDAYQVFGNASYLNMAIKNADFILKKQKKNDGSLFHSYKAGKSTINAYLEDYSFVVQAFIALYQATYNEKWLTEASSLVDYCKAHFYDDNSGMFYFTSDKDPELIARKTEVYDNVIPASNSSFANGLYDLGLLLDREPYISWSEQMLHNVQNDFPQYPSGFSNWGILMMKMVYPYYEIAIAGEAIDEKMSDFRGYYIPNRIFVFDKNGTSSLPLMEYKFLDDETMIYVCVNKSCQLPVNEVTDAMKQIK